jgi:hypothetical protein
MRLSKSLLLEKEDGTYPASDAAARAPSGSNPENFQQALQEPRADKASGIPLTRTLRTLEAVISQPDSAPVLQSGVARSIVASIVEVDGFGWSTKNKMRTKRHGWQIEHVCIDSRENRDIKQNYRRRRKQDTAQNTREESNF